MEEVEEEEEEGKAGIILHDKLLRQDEEKGELRRISVMWKGKRLTRKLLSTNAVNSEVGKRGRGRKREKVEELEP